MPGARLNVSYLNLLITCAFFIKFSMFILPVVFLLLICKSFFFFFLISLWIFCGLNVFQISSSLSLSSVSDSPAFCFWWAKFLILTKSIYQCIVWFVFFISFKEVLSYLWVLKTNSCVMTLTLKNWFLWILWNKCLILFVFCSCMYNGLSWHLSLKSAFPWSSISAACQVSIYIPFSIP